MTIEETFSFLNVSLETEEFIYVTFCCVEMIEHLIGLLISVWFLFIVWKSSVFHINLTWILASLACSLCLTSATKCECYINLALFKFGLYYRLILQEFLKIFSVVVNGFVISHGKYIFATMGVVEMAWEMCILSGKWLFPTISIFSFLS